MEDDKPKPKIKVTENGSTKLLWSTGERFIHVLVQHQNML